MALFTANYYSNALMLNTDLNIVIPTPNSDELMNNKDTSYYDKGRVFQVMFLLHGTYGDYSDWGRLTSIERYAQDAKLAVVMPSCANSFFQDMLYGPKYLKFLTEELPEFIGRMFPVSTKREDSFIAGLSMGGYGAWHTALMRPEKYAAALSLSGGFELGGMVEERRKDTNSPWPFYAIFGDRAVEELNNSDVSISHRIKELLDKGVEMPKLFQTVGRDDFVYEGNQKMKKTLEDLGVDWTYEEHEGIHDWIYWDTHIQRAIAWLPREANTVKG